MSALLRELRHAVRALRRSPGFALGGVGRGIAGALALAPVLSGVLYGVGTHDPASLGGAALALLAVMFLASGLPARRAARIAPSEALKGE
jgi:ABC-type antimicrobial peptide transport system permease subunit